MRAIDRIIEVKVRGGHLTKDNRNAGTQHEANVTFLRIDFDEGWDSYAKKVTFWDALMGNPVKRTLTTDMLENVQASTRVYLIPIPGEAMGEGGDLTFIVDGYYVEPFFGYREYLTLSAPVEGVDEYTIGLADVLNEEEQDALRGRQLSIDGKVYTIVGVGYKGDSQHTILTLGEAPVGVEEGKLIYPADGKRKRSLADTLWVKPAPIEEDAAEPTDPTPTQAEQLQVQIDHIKDDIQDAEVAAGNALRYAEEAETSANGATAAAQYAAQQANSALEATSIASLAAGAAQKSADAAAKSEASADEHKAAAQAAAEAAEQNKVDSEACQKAAEAAHAAADAANTSAAASASAAAASAASANENAVIAKNAKDAAATSASTAESAAITAQTNANATMNFASNAAASADAAQAAADAAAAAVNGGTVAEAIAKHNTSTDAHSDMRTELSAVARAKTGGEIDQRLQNRVEKSGDTMTGILTFDTPGLFSAFQKKRTIGDVNYLMRAGIGNDGNGASLCMRLFSVAADGTETVVSHIEADSTGVYWVSPGGIKKTIAHSGNLGVLTAGVE